MDTLEPAKTIKHTNLLIDILMKNCNSVQCYIKRTVPMWNLSTLKNGLSSPNEFERKVIGPALPLRIVTLLLEPLPGSKNSICIHVVDNKCISHYARSESSLQINNK